MELLNKNGLTLMDYRRRYKRHYGATIDEALKNAIYVLYKDGQIPEKLFRILLDENIEDGDVYAYLVSKREYTKSSTELNSEFDKVRERVNNYLIKIGFTKNVCTENSIGTNRIYVIKQYDISKELLQKFFGLTPTEIIPLMKRKGFMDKFCVLRLSQAFKEIYSSLKVPEHIDHGYYLVYYNKSIQGFSIDYKYMVNINYIMDEERLVDVMDQIKDLDAIVEKQFQQKMSFANFRNVYKDLMSKELQAEIENIVIPIRTGKRSKDIRKPELIVEETLQAESSSLKGDDVPLSSDTKKNTDVQVPTEEHQQVDQTAKSVDEVKSLEILELTPKSNTAEENRFDNLKRDESPKDQKVPIRTSENRPMDHQEKQNDQNKSNIGKRQNQHCSDDIKSDQSTPQQPKQSISSNSSAPIPSKKQFQPNAQIPKRVPDLTNKPKQLTNNQHSQNESLSQKNVKQEKNDRRNDKPKQVDQVPEKTPDKNNVIILDDDDATVTTPTNTKPEHSKKQKAENMTEKPSGQSNEQKDSPKPVDPSMF